MFMENPIKNPQWMWGYTYVINNIQKIVTIAVNENMWGIFDDNTIYHIQETFENNTRKNIKQAIRFAKKHFYELKPL